MSESRQIVKTAVLAKLFDLTPQRIAQLARSGIVRRVSSGKYDFLYSVHGYIKYLQGLSESGKGDTEDLQKLRERKLAAEVRIIEMEEKEKRGDLVPMKQAVERTVNIWSPIASMIKDMPSRLSARVNPSDPVLAREELEEYAREILRGVEERCTDRN